MVADPLTKPLSQELFSKHIRNMGLQVIDWNISDKWEMLDFYVWLSIFIITIIYHLHVWKYYWYMWLIINNELEEFALEVQRTFVLEYNIEE